MKVCCPECGAPGPIHAIRHITQFLDLTDMDGVDVMDVSRWENGTPLRHHYDLSCEACGHMWPVDRRQFVLP